jgi:plastocyanin
MGDHFFSPAQLTVSVGTTVLWRMTGSQTPDVLSLDGKFYSQTIGPGQSFSHTFRETGTFRYICTPHQGDGMVGEVTVR